jgi:hypothetical protein
MRPSILLLVAVTILFLAAGAHANATPGTCPADPDPATQGYWHRQCLGLPAGDPDCPGIDPGPGQEPPQTTEPGFCPELYSCADNRLGDLESSYGQRTCEGMDAVPPSDTCERALKQLTALILNVCSDRLSDTCRVDVSAEGCTSTNVGDLVNEIDHLIVGGECNTASACAAAVNEGTPAALARRVALFVDQSFHGDLESEIARLAADIEADLGVSTVVELVDVAQTTPEEIRATIQDLYVNIGLLGSVLIGDIPTAYWGDYSPGSKSATDAFYEDLDDSTWADPDGNGIYNMVVDEDGDGEYDWFHKTWIGEHNREVWCGRLLPPRTASHTERVELLRDYLDRNHEYRTGSRTYRRGMIYAESVKHNGDPSDGEDDYATVYDRAVTVMDASWLFDRSGGDELDFVWSEDLTKHMKQWLTGASRSYEYGLLNVHGSSSGQWFGASNWLYSSDYQRKPTGTLLVELASCNNGNFTHSNYLAGWVLFGGGALAVTGNTTPVFYVGGVRPNADHRLLSLGLTLGEVRRTYVLANDSGVLLGDPTLRLRQPAAGPELVVDRTHLLFPSELAAGLPHGYTQERSITLTNVGSDPIEVYYRIMSLTSLDGRKPWGNEYQSDFFVTSQFEMDPMLLAPGESRPVNVEFYYDGQSGPGTYRSRFILYTDSSTTPYLWIGVEKTLLQLE